MGSDGIRMLDAALKNLDEMVGLLESLVSHTAVGQKTLHSTTLTSTRRALDHAIANLRSEVTATGAEFSIADLPSVSVESEALLCLFQNLVSNALKFRRPEVAPHISVSANREGDMWVIAIADNGIGIDAANWRRIFEPLQRLNALISGRGIGLATCRKIVERTGETIWVASEPGSSTTLQLSLPAQGQEAE